MFLHIGTTCRVMPSTLIKKWEIPVTQMYYKFVEIDVAVTYQKRSGNSDFYVAQ